MTLYVRYSISSLQEEQSLSLMGKRISCDLAADQITCGPQKPLGNL